MELFYYHMVYRYCNFFFWAGTACPPVDFISNVLRSFLVSYNLFLIWCVCFPEIVSLGNNKECLLGWADYFFTLFATCLVYKLIECMARIIYLSFATCTLKLALYLLFHIVVLCFILASICQYVLSIFLSISDDTCS